MMSRIVDGATTTEPTSWLNSRRLRVHGLLLALCLWSTYAWIMATPGVRDRNGLVKGTDFLHYYTLGSLAREHRGAALYDMPAQSDFAQQRISQAGRLLFVPLYGPQVSLLFAPLAGVSYAWALTAWLMLNAAIYSLCCYAVWRTCPSLRSEVVSVFLLALAYPAFFHLIAWGQTSGLALGCFTAAYLFMRSGRMISAGLAIGCLIFKPQLGLAAAFVFLFAREWKMVFGALVSAIAQFSVGWWYYGTAVTRDYASHLLRVREVLPQLEPRPYQMHDLRSFWAMLLPWPHVAHGLYAACALAVLGIALLCWKSGAPLSLRFSSLLLGTVLVSPHLTVYDLVILAPAFLLLADLAVTESASVRRRLGPLLYSCYAFPLMGPLSIWTHVQLSVPAMAALLWAASRLSEGSGKGHSWKEDAAVRAG